MKLRLTSKKITTLLIVLIWLSFSYCASIVRSTIKEDDKQIPIGFGKEDVTILAIKQHDRYNKWLQQRFSENYFGKYEIINASELSSAKYNDLKVYKYIFI